LAINPGIYGAWLEHLVRRGHIVIYPRYQDGWQTPPEEFRSHTLAAVRDALDVLDTAPGRVRPDRDRFALIGHSAGGNLAAELAAVAAAEGLPRARAVIALMPADLGRTPGCSLATIVPETNIVAVVGDRDWLAGDTRARSIFAETARIPRERKLYVVYQSDPTAPEPFIADHVAPTAYLARLDSGEGPLLEIQRSQARLDELDRHGFWRLADVVLDASFRGETLAKATDRGRILADLGRFGANRPVRKPFVRDSLEGAPRVLSWLSPRAPLDRGSAGAGGSSRGVPP
jgi:acetyl esterase/lipase